MPDLAPVVVFVYNRPEHTRQTLASLAANPLAAESDLVIYADGPKKPEHAHSVQAARAVARAAHGFKSIRMIERDDNLGLANSIIAGVTEACEASGRVIVIEDDLVVAPEFLGFLNAGLHRYKNEPRVLQVSGYAYPAHNSTTPKAFFLPMVSCWGWATWSRGWAQFDSAMSVLKTLDADPMARRRFNVDDTYDYYGMACQQRDGKIDSWGIRWQLSLFACDGLVLYPRESLVYNSGVDASGTHGKGHAAFQRRLGNSVIGSGVVSWPRIVAKDEVAMTQVKELLRANRPGILQRIVERFRA